MNNQYKFKTYTKFLYRQKHYQPLNHEQIFSALNQYITLNRMHKVYVQIIGAGRMQQSLKNKQTNSLDFSI